MIIGAVQNTGGLKTRARSDLPQVPDLSGFRHDGDRPHEGPNGVACCRVSLTSLTSAGTRPERMDEDCGGTHEPAARLGRTRVDTRGFMRLSRNGRTSLGQTYPLTDPDRPSVELFRHIIGGTHGQNRTIAPSQATDRRQGAQIGEHP
ncbi:hypothetical protein JSE7799_02292 [Jannaschia seosinensis]|uniref:Uncharacterized protein n=1 Tax=Jannaschia seosinensis TaxID=313367 RepID=A0A0M7BDY5_9RHOB|nr:hypothetical protein JSE7799_02292 [Jannaschia seosinensis]